MKRSCQYYKEFHWNYECSDRNIMLIENENSDDNQSEIIKLNEKNMKILQTFHSFEEKEEDDR